MKKLLRLLPWKRALSHLLMPCHIMGHHLGKSLNNRDNRKCQWRWTDDSNPEAWGGDRQKATETALTPLETDLTRKTPADRTQHQSRSFNGLSCFLQIKQPLAPLPRRWKTFRFRCKLSNFLLKKTPTKTNKQKTTRWNTAVAVATVAMVIWLAVNKQTKSVPFS